MKEQSGKKRIVALILVFLTILGLLLRLWISWRVNQVLPDTTARLLGDETGYDGLAYALFWGSFFEWPGRTPLYPLFLALCYWIFGHSFETVLYVQSFVGALVVPLTFLLSRRFTGPKTSLCAAALVAIHPSLILQVTRLYTEVLYTPLLLLMLLSLLKALEKPVVSRFCLAGAMLAILNLCRPSTVLFPALLPFLMPSNWAIKQKAGMFLVYVGMIVIVTAPWTYHNYRTHHAFLVYSVTPAPLWQGSPEFYHLSKNNNLVQIWSKQLNPKVNGGKDPFSIEGNRYFTDRAIASIKAEPGVYVWYSLQKLFYFWIGNPVNDWPGYNTIFSINAMRPYYSTPRIFGVFFARLLPFVALISLIILRHRLKTFLPLIAVCGYYMLLHAISYTEVRYSEPLYPILAVFIASSLGEFKTFSKFRLVGKLNLYLDR
jgi:4-amino-4-deoxy-L-arabinose transferase-like glycosyltransferase